MTLRDDISADTQAALLLIAPLLTRRQDGAPEPLQPSEHRRFTGFLSENGWSLADLLAKGAEDALTHERLPLDADRLRLLLSRGFLLSQALEHWRSRAIWVVGAADDDYPPRLKRLGKDAPPILFGCGDHSLLRQGGLAVVGSRRTDEDVLDYAERIGKLTARAGRALISGGARGVDQAAMRGALEADGAVVGVLSNDLQGAALRGEHRSALIDGHLTLVSPYAPAAGFNVGNAMQRNKMIYAMADAALIVNSDYQQGGTWAGAVEQLDKLNLAPVYVRCGEGKAFEALIRKGACLWPDPETPESFEQALAAAPAQPEHQTAFLL